MTEAIVELVVRIKDSYATNKGWNTARTYILESMSSAKRKNGWQLSEQIGETAPYRIQQFLYRGSWDVDEVRNKLRDYICEHFDEQNGVLIVDKIGFLKQDNKSA